MYILVSGSSLSFQSNMLANISLYREQTMAGQSGASKLATNMLETKNHMT